MSSLGPGCGSLAYTPKPHMDAPCELVIISRCWSYPEDQFLLLESLLPISKKDEHCSDMSTAKALAGRNSFFPTIS